MVPSRHSHWKPRGPARPPCSLPRTGIEVAAAESRHIRCEYPGERMIFAIVFAQVWGVLQLLVLGTLARTVRVRTVLAAMAVGLYAIGPLTVLLQLSWIRVAASIVGKTVPEMSGIASYTVDPFIEEALKLLPLVLLMLIPTIRRQWSLTDCVLI